MPDLSSSPKDLYTHAMEGDRADNSRPNFQEALAILQFKVLIEEEKAARAHRLVAIGTFLLFLATIGLVIAKA